MYDKVLGSAEVVYFTYAPPMFHTNPKELTRWPNPPFRGAETWQNSVFYYWWLFLQENEDYRTTCQNGGRGPKEELYQDFGDVHTGSFKDWWVNHGRELFREPPSEGVKLARFTEDSSNRVAISVPMTGDLERTLAEIRAILQPAFQTFRLKVGPSQAEYPVATKPVLSSLHRLYRIHRARIEHPELKLWEISEFLDLTTSTQPKETQSSNISRSLTLVDFLIKQVGNGLFPVMTETQLKAAEQIQRTRWRWKISRFDPVKTPERQEIELGRYRQAEERRKRLNENGIF
jgi:hypothetical protein